MIIVADTILSDAATAVASRRERLLEEQDLLRIARGLATGAIDLSGQSTVAAERSGDRGSGGRGGPNLERGETAACPDTTPPGGDHNQGSVPFSAHRPAGAPQAPPRQEDTFHQETATEPGLAHRAHVA